MACIILLNELSKDQVPVGTRRRSRNFYDIVMKFHDVVTKLLDIVMKFHHVVMKLHDVVMKFHHVNNETS